ncbi:MAG: response regulator transcription factor [Nocardioidaceae bacterium]
MSTVLVVDDEERVRALLARSLSSEGHTVVTAADGAEAIERLSQGGVDLVLLDVMMPGVNGLQVLTLMGQRDDATPVIVVSAVTDVSTRVQALDRGAVDVMAKPFHTAEMVARVRRHLADEPRKRTSQRYLVAGGITLDLDRRRARTAGGDVTLTEREFTLLAHLMRRRGEVCRRDELLHDVWGLGFDPGSNVVDVCLGRLRTKLVEPPIETIRGVGYCFYGR